MFGIPMSELPSLALADSAVMSPMDDMKHVLLSRVVTDWLLSIDMGLIASVLMDCRSESLASSCRYILR